MRGRGARILEQPTPLLRVSGYGIEKLPPHTCARIFRVEARCMPNSAISMHAHHPHSVDFTQYPHSVDHLVAPSQTIETHVNESH